VGGVLFFFFSFFEGISRGCLGGGGGGVAGYHSQYCVNVTGLGSIPYRALVFFSLSSYPDLLKVTPRLPSGCVGEAFSLGIKIVGA